MPSNPPGNRPQFVGDERTQLLPRVARQSRTEAVQPVWDGRDRAAEESRRRVEQMLAESWQPLDPETEQRWLDDWQAECRKTAAQSWLLDRAALTAPYRFGYGWGPRREDATELIPAVPPAQPQADWDRPEGPPCRDKTVAIALLVGAGVVIGFLGAVALFALAVS